MALTNIQVSPIPLVFNSSAIFFRGWGWGGEGWDVGFRGCVGATTSNLNGQYYRKSLIMFETMQKDKQTTDNTRLRCVYI